MKVNMFMKEEMHANQAEFCLLALISKYAWDPWCRSLTTDITNRLCSAFLPSISLQQKCHANVWQWVQSCRPKGCCFPFTHSWKIAVKGSFILGDLNWKFFKVSYPVGTHTDMYFLLRVSVMDHPTFAKLILGRWNDLLGWNLCPC